MITIILNKLTLAIELQGGGAEAIEGFGTMGQIVNLFNIASMIPPYYIQLIVGLYVIEIIYILSITLVTVESGYDELGETYEIAENMKKGIMMYLIAALVSVIALALLAGVAVGGMGA